MMSPGAELEHRTCPRCRREVSTTPSGHLRAHECPHARRRVGEKPAHCGVCLGTPDLRLEPGQMPMPFVSGIRAKLRRPSKKKNPRAVRRMRVHARGALLGHDRIGRRRRVRAGGNLRAQALLAVRGADLAGCRVKPGKCHCGGDGRCCACRAVAYLRSLHQAEGGVPKDGPQSERQDTPTPRGSH
jgi:hypothetical protein